HLQPPPVLPDDLPIFIFAVPKEYLLASLSPKKSALSAGSRSRFHLILAESNAPGEVARRKSHQRRRGGSYVRIWEFKYCRLFAGPLNTEFGLGHSPDRDTVFRGISYRAVHSPKRKRPSETGEFFFPTGADLVASVPKEVTKSFEKCALLNRQSTHELLLYVYPGCVQAIALCK